MEGFEFFNYHLGTFSVSTEVTMRMWLWIGSSSKVSCVGFWMSMSNQRELSCSKVAMHKKLYGGFCACVDVMQNFCAKFPRIINIQIYFLIFIYERISQCIIIN